MAARPLDTDKLRLWQGDDGICRAVIAPGAVLSLEDAEASLETLRKLCGNHRYRLMVDQRKISSIERPAREHLAKRGAAHAVAIVVDSPVSQVIAAFVLRFRRPETSVKVFTDEGAALEWLKGVED